MNLASTRRNWPSGRGFERWYGFLGAETNQWYPELVYDNHPVDQPTSPEEGYHLTVDLTDKAIEFIRDAKAIAPEKPFFLYYAPGACHAPHHAPKEWIDRYKGRFDMGYEAMREQTLARQKELGIVPPDTELPPSTRSARPRPAPGPDGKPFPPMDVTRPWASLSADEKRLFARMAEVYAGFLSHADDQIGRLLDFLEEYRPAREHPRHRRLGQRRQRRGRPERLGQRDEVHQRDPGRPRRRTSPCSTSSAARRPTTTTRTAGRWRSTRRSRCGSATSSTAALATRASSRGRPASRPRARCATQYHHAIDLVPTMLDVLGVEPPETIKGHVQSRLRRRQHAVQLRRRDAASARQTQFYSMLGSRAIWHEGWKAVTTHPRSAAGATSTTTSGSSTTPTSTAPSCTTWPTSSPEKVRELVSLWFAEAGAERGVPARRPLGARDHHDAAAAALPAAQPLRLLPRTRRRAGVAGGQRPQPLVLDRRAGGHPGAGRRKASCSPTARGSAATRSTSRTTGCTTSTTSSACFEQKVVADRGPADRREPHPVGLLRQGRRGPARRGGGHAVALPRRDEGRRGPDQDPARQVHDRRRGTVRRARQRRRRHRRLPRRTRRGASPAGPSNGSPSTSAASRTSTSSARPRPCSCASSASVSRPAGGRPGLVPRHGGVRHPCGVMRPGGARRDAGPVTAAPHEGDGGWRHAKRSSGRVDRPGGRRRHPVRGQQVQR